MRATILLASSLALSLTGSARAADPTGLWKSETGKSHYRVGRCGSGICVDIHWIIEGPTERDVNNPDPAKRNRRVMGIEIVTNARSIGPDRWSGNIYNFKDGRTYAFTAQMIGANQLRFSGCVLGGLFCLTQNMARIP